MLRLLLGVCVLGLAACSNHAALPPDSASSAPDTTMHPIDDVLAAHTDSLMAIDGVTGVGQALCDSQPCIRVYVLSRSEVENRLPDEIDGYRVDVVETGQITPLPTDG